MLTVQCPTKSSALEGAVTPVTHCIDGHTSIGSKQGELKITENAYNGHSYPSDI